MIQMETFRTFIAGLGFEPPTHIEPGRFVRFATKDKRGDDAGSCKLFPDGEGGIVCDFRTGASWTWQAKRERPYADAEKRAWRDLLAKERTEAAAHQKSEEAAAAKRARVLWDQAQTAPSEHPYLVTKRVQAHGARIYAGPLASSGVRLNGALILAVHSAAGSIQSLQFISPEGEKRFLPGGRKAGGYYAVGKPSEVICVVEGFATGASLHESTGHAVAIAFDAGNLEAVAKGLRAKYPKVKIVLCGDNDESGVGQRAADSAARAVGGKIALPAEAGRDWNDVHREQGPEAVRGEIEAVLATSDAPVVALKQGTGAEAQATVQAPPSNAPGGWSVELLRGSAITPEPIRWVWNEWLARGKLHMLAGSPGTGKTTIALTLAATITKGGRWPDGTRAAPATIAIWSGEDDAKDVLVPRLMMAGADMSRVLIVGSVSRDQKEPRSFDPARDHDLLMASLADIDGLSLLIVDPVVSAVAADSNKAPEVRRALQPFVDIASKLDCSVLGISHFSKGSAGRDPVERVLGSVSFGAVPRVIMATAKRTEEQGGGRMLIRSKSNIGPDGGGYCYDFQQAALPQHSKIIASSVLWGNALDGTAKELLALAETETAPEEQSQHQSAVEWLEDLLRESGGLPTGELFKIGRTNGFPERTVYRAKDKLGVRVQTSGFGANKVSVWSLPNPAKPSNSANFASLNIGEIGGIDGKTAPVAGPDPAAVADAELLP